MSDTKRLKIHHVTRYRFDDPVQFALQQVRKTPRSFAGQTVLNWSTQISGGQKQLDFIDYNGNHTDLLSVDRDATTFEVICEGEVEVTNTNGVIGRHTGSSPLWLFLWQTSRTQAKSGVKALVKTLTGETELDKLHALSAAIRDEIKYEVGASEPEWGAEEALAAGKGVCQDHTHVFLAGARALGIPARYVSGYLMLNHTTTQDAMHAWAEAYVPDLGWVGFDISNGYSPDTRYVRVATGMDYADAAPVSGARIGGVGEQLDVLIDVAQQ